MQINVYKTAFICILSWIYVRLDGLFFIASDKFKYTFSEIFHRTLKRLTYTAQHFNRSVIKWAQFLQTMQLTERQNVYSTKILNLLPLTFDLSIKDTPKRSNRNSLKIKYVYNIQRIVHSKTLIASFSIRMMCLNFWTCHLISDFPIWIFSIFVILLFCYFIFHWHRSYFILLISRNLFSCLK